MRRVPIVAAILLLAGLAGLAEAQTAPPQPPPELRIPDLEERPASLILGRVYPLGWSPAGLFAYVYEPADEACACYFFELTVQDLKSDRLVWHFEYNSGSYELDDPQRFDDLDAIWKAKGQEFAAKLHELGIVRRAEPKLELFADGPPPLKIAIATEEKGDDQEVFRHLSRYVVDLLAPQGRKTIFRSDAAGVTDATFGPLLVRSQGFLRSPHEARVAVLLEETWRGWELLPLVVKLRFAGADLERGFR